MWHWLALAGLLMVACAAAARPAGIPRAKTFTNSLGIDFARIEPGTFQMGFEGPSLPDRVAGQGWRRKGDFDEQPAHQVALTRPFYLAVTEVTNAQYEQFDPHHRELRGKLGFSKDDDEAVVFVSWHDAVAFCRWLAEKEERPYRLPTEAEWEYACRADTTTPYHTGQSLPAPFHKNARMSWYPGEARSKPNEVVPLTVGRTPPNPWGLRDVHGNVEEWCADWYGPYPQGPVTDPRGPAEGQFRVTRGGSHSTELYYLRSANRSGTLPEDKSWLVGFRVALGEPPRGEPAPPPPPPRHRRDVAQREADWTKGPDPEEPFFRGPLVYVRIPPDANGPRFAAHNHDPALVWCPNGDLLAIWYSCHQEPGRELAILASRLRRGAEGWEEASVFWDAPDRNDHAPAMWNDGQGTIYHFNGLSAAATWGNLATVLRTSTDSGASWSRARLIIPEHGTRHMPVESVFRTREGAIVLPCDAVTGGRGGTATWLSRDGGQSWEDPGGKAAGIHAGIVQLRDGRLMALGRGDNIEGRMPKSLSDDMGKSWTYSPSPFPPIGGGQRLVLLRLREGPLFFASFAPRIEVRDATGARRQARGLFAALSHDEGATWDVRRAIAPDEELEVETFDGRRMKMTPYRSEPRGYLSVCQTPDGVVHLISSRLYYAFNLRWLTAPPPAPPPPPQAQALPVKQELPTALVPRQAPSKSGPWRFTGSGVEEGEAVDFPEGGGMRVDTGPGQRARWVDDSPEGFGRARREAGFAAEIRLQVLKSTHRQRGIDFEAYAGDGSPRGRRYFISITTSGVYWYDHGPQELAEGLDNRSAPHTWRLSVRPDGIVQVYRDGELLAVRQPARQVDPLLRTSRPYLQWGEGAGGSEADALVRHVAYDLGGPSQPQ
ncbi:MAG: SUMF1/EgtB/PvdO family nonheme iron enzyme [Candidatus Brocadiia bacterium]